MYIYVICTQCAHTHTYKTSLLLRSLNTSNRRETYSNKL